MADWPQAGGNAAHTAFQAETLGTSWSVNWRYQHHVSAQEKLFPQVQAVVSAGKVVVPTLHGKVRAFVAGPTTSGGGAVSWTATLGAPIMGSAACDGTNAYVADAYGRLWAFKLSDGTQATGWSNPVQVTANGLPFQCSPLIADSKLLLGGADGVFYARSLANGSSLWSYTVGAPILQTAAYGVTTAGVGVVVFGAMSMTVYGLNTATGSTRLRWSTAVSGSAFKDYWPVIVGQQVLVRPWAPYPTWVNGAPSGAPSTPTRGIPVSDFLQDALMTTALANYVASPSSYVKALYVLPLDTGVEAANQQLIHWYYAIDQHGAPPPPCVDANGRVVIPGLGPPSGNYGSRAGWVQVDLATRKVTGAGLYDGSTAGWRNGDENMCVSAASNGIFAMHIQEANAQTTGFFQTLGTGAPIWRQFSAGAGTTELFINTQGGGANPAAIANGMAYHLAHPHTLVAWRGV